MYRLASSFQQRKELASIALFVVFNNSLDRQNAHFGCLHSRSLLDYLRAEIGRFHVICLATVQYIM